MADGHEKMLRYVLDNSQELIIGFNRQGCIVYVNERVRLLVIRRENYKAFISVNYIRMFLKLLMAR